MFSGCSTGPWPTPFFVWQWALRGQTGQSLGQRLMGIRTVCEETGQPLGPGRSVLLCRAAACAPATGPRNSQGRWPDVPETAAQLHGSETFQTVMEQWRHSRDVRSAGGSATDYERSPGHEDPEPRPEWRTGIGASRLERGPARPWEE
ncbi:RDD family protein [Streptomyces orinoci]|uniref:RDD family protein n=1 Tax=Streptomyces orinoci TaxID=67339 RepID=A0ABV3K106_STRON